VEGNMRIAFYAPLKALEGLNFELSSLSASRSQSLITCARAQ